ncbi:MAG: O-antigen ligase family protein [Candidatus Promineifilaceae bacterium]|nr:O-antigen ligase family protein [Candidatus Promineifilaceae bacterium]
MRYRYTASWSVTTPFDAPIAIFLLTALIGVWASYNRSGAWALFWQLVGAAALFYAFANTQVLYGNRAALVHRWLLTLFGLAVAVYFAVTHDWAASPTQYPMLDNIGQALQRPLPDVPGHRLNPNVAGGLMAMMLPFMVANWQATRGTGDLFLPAAALGSILVVLVGLSLSASLGAWIGVAGAMMMVGWWRLARVLAPSRRYHMRVLFGGIAAAAIVLWFLLVLQFPTLQGWLEDLMGGGHAGQLDRLALVERGLILAADYPIVGAGLGSFMMLDASYALLTHVGFAIHSHNLYLDVAVQQGLLGLLALVWMWLLVGEAVWRAGQVKRVKRRHSERSTLAKAERSTHSGPVQRRLLFAAGLSLAVVLVHSLFDDILYGSRGALLLFLPLAFAVPSLQRASSDGHRGRIKTIAALVAIGLLLLVLFRGSLLSRWHSNLAAVRQSRLELSVYDWPEWPVQDAVRRELDLQPIVRGYERALRADPSNASAARRLGQIELSLGRYSAALQHLQQAYRVTPDNRTVWQLLGEAYALNEQPAQAVQLWSVVENDQNQLQIRIAWYESLGENLTATRLRQLAQASRQQVLEDDRRVD